MAKLNSKKLRYLLLGTILLVLGAGSGYFLTQNPLQIPYLQTQNQKNLTFLKEVYSTIQDNYWQDLPDQQLSQIFLQASASLTQKPTPPQAKTKKELFQTLKENLKSFQTEKAKNAYTLSLTKTVLNQLQPKGVNQLFTQEQTQKLAQRVANKAQQDHYQTLEVEKDAPAEKIQEKAQEKLAKISSSTFSAQKKQKETEKIQKAQEVLSDQNSRENYDQLQVNPTVTSRLLSPSTLYLHLTKFSPQTLDDIKNAAQKAEQKATDQLDTLVLDLRNNVGGAIDGLPYFLGPFVGPNQNAYQFFHQGEKEPHTTKTGWLDSLVRYKKVIILVNQNTQSTAEVFAATLKKYNVGVLLGETTKGWGTIERVFPLKNQLDPEKQHAILLVHRLTLNETGQPIQGNGVTPDIKIDSNWQQELFSYYPSNSLIQDVQKAWDQL